MSYASEFDFGDQSVANAYDSILTPVLFSPWAESLVENFRPWEGVEVLDLATGTGILAHKLAGEIGSTGKIVAADINAEMLEIAKLRFTDSNLPVEFLVSPAHPLELPDNRFDIVVCQQGFQFFPDKHEAAKEIHRVLKKDGKVILSTWCPLVECEFFGMVYQVLQDMKEHEIAEMIRVPFDFMQEELLLDSFEGAGFVNISINKQSKELIFEEGPSHAINVVYATPIAPKLRELPEDKQSQIQREISDIANTICQDGKTMGSMSANILSAVKG